MSYRGVLSVNHHHHHHYQAEDITSSIVSRRMAWLDATAGTNPRTARYPSIGRERRQQRRYRAPLVGNSLPSKIRLCSSCLLSTKLKHISSYLSFHKISFRPVSVYWAMVAVWFGERVKGYCCTWCILQCEWLGMFEFRYCIPRLSSAVASLCLLIVCIHSTMY